MVSDKLVMDAVLADVPTRPCTSKDSSGLVNDRLLR